MDKDSLFDHENWQSYSLASPNSELLLSNVKKLSLLTHKKKFLEMLLN